VFLFLLVSCGARKVDKEVIKTDTTASISQIEKEKTSINKDSCSENKIEIKNNIITEEDELEPIDTTKPIEKIDSDGKITKYKNTRIKHKKTIDNSQINQEQNVSESSSFQNESEINNNQNLKSSSESSIKHIIKEQFNWSTFILSFWWLWLIIIIAFIIIKKYYFPQLNLLSTAKGILTKLKN
jgi:hypothetical protein